MITSQSRFEKPPAVSLLTAIMDSVVIIKVGGNIRENKQLMELHRVKLTRTRAGRNNGREERGADSCFTLNWICEV